MNFKEASNETLCAVIITNRYLGSFQEEAIRSMEELAFRRGAGDGFLYEEYIEKKFSELANFQVNLKSKMNNGLGKLKF